VPSQLDPSDLGPGLAEKLRAGGPLDAETLNMACFWLSRQLEGLDLSRPEAAPLARRLLRVVGRVIIDTGAQGADPGTWPNTEEMALVWIDEALRPLGYQVRAHPDGGRAELPEPQEDWM